MGQGTSYTERRVASFLLRFWVEPRELEDAPPVFRGYIRHLQTGEEMYFSDPETLIEHVFQWLKREEAASIAGGAGREPS